MAEPREAIRPEPVGIARYFGWHARSGNAFAQFDYRVTDDLGHEHAGRVSINTGRPSATFDAARMSAETRERLRDRALAMVQRRVSLAGRRERAAEVQEHIDMLREVQAAELRGDN